MEELMPVYDQAVIRQMLADAFDAGEIDTLAFDLFPRVQGDFSNGMPKSERIKRIVTEAVQHKAREVCPFDRYLGGCGGSTDIE